MSTGPTNDETDFDQLVRLAKTQREAFAALYDRYFPLVHRYCQRRLLNCAAADDLSSEVFLHVAQSIRRFPGQTELDFRRWIYRITTNEINAYFRKRLRRQTLFERALRGGWWNDRTATPDSSTTNNTSGEADTEEQTEILLQALAALSPREQSVITLRFWEGLSYEEVGHIVDARAATVRVIASRAIAALREKLVGQQPSNTLPREGGGS